MISDDYDDISLSGIWSVEGPSGTSAALGSAGDEQYLVLTTSTGNHDIWNSNKAARALQDVADTDFEIEARFLTTPAAKYQMQGLLVEQDADNWIRFDTYSNGSTLYAFAAVTLGGSSSAQFNVALPVSAAPYLRVTREGDVWTFSYSVDGTNWTEAGSFTQALNVTSVGPFAGSTNGVAYSAEVDYFASASDPLTTEDGQQINSAPTPVDDAFATPENTDLTFTAVDLLANDTDPNGDTLSVTATGTPGSGTLTDNGNGTFTYTPNAGFTGTDSFTYTVSDGSEVASATVQIAVALLPGDPVSDDYDDISLSGIWSVEGPSGTSAALGSAGDEQYLVLTTSTGNHDIWNSNKAARALQDVADTDFEIEARFLTTPAAKYQMQGLLVEQDADNWIRFDTYSNGSTLYAFAAVTLGGSSSAQFNVALPVSAAPYLRVTREGDVWTFSYSVDGTNWTEAGSFTQALNVTSVGPFAGSTNGVAYSAEVDYFASASDPLTTEDGQQINSAPTPVDDAFATPENTDLTFTAVDLLANDTDPNGDTLSVTATGTPGSGTLTDNGNGTFTYTPNAGFTGTDSFTYTVSDGSEVASATVQIAVALLPGDPVSDDYDDISLSGIWSVEGPSGTSAALGSAGDEQYLVLTTSTGNHDIWNSNKAARALQDVADTDFEIEARFLTTPAAKYQMQGLLVEQDADNWIRFDTYSNGSTLYAFAAVTLGGSSSAQFNVALPVSAAPYLRVTREGDVWTFSYSVDGTNWTEAGSFTQALNVTSVGPFAGSTNGVAYSAEVDYFASASDPLTTEDGQQINSAPTPVDDAFATPENTDLTFTAVDLLANDTDPNGDTLSVTATGTPGSGTLTDNGNGTFTYTPNAGFTGTDSFTYTVSDGTLTDTATVQVTVSEVVVALAGDDFSAPNLDPVWAVAGPAGVAASLGTSGSNAFLSLSTPAGGGDLWNANGSARATQTIANGDFDIAARFLSTPGAPGQGQGLLIEGASGSWIAFQLIMTATGPELVANVTLNGISDTRISVAVDDMAASYLRVTRADNLWTLSYSADGVSWTDAGQFTQAFVADAVGIAASSALGGYTAEVDYFMDVNAPLAIEDGAAPNAPPVAADDSFDVAEGATLIISAAELLANDSDADGDTLTITDVGAPGSGVLTDNGNGTWTYAPNAGFSGADSLTYTVSDGSETTTASIVLNVTATPGQADIFSDDFEGQALDPGWTFLGIAGGASLDSDADDSWLEIVSPPSVPVDAYTNLTTPRVLQDIDDGDFQISVKFLNEPQQAFQEHGLLIVQDDQNWIRFDVAFTGGLKILVGVIEDGNRGFPLFQNIDPGEASHLRIVRTGSEYSFEYSADGIAWTVATTITSGIEANAVGPFAGSTAFEGPVPGFVSEVDWFEASSDPIQGEDNAVPEAGEDLLSTGTGVGLTIDIATDLLANDTDGDGDALSFAGIEVLPAGTLTDNGNGTLSYTPVTGFTGIDSFTYAVTDGADTVTATTRIAVSAPGNTAPDLADDIASTAEGAGVTINVLNNDSDINGDPLSIVTFGQGAGGAVTEAGGVLTYTPNVGFSGADSFTYMAEDGLGGLAEALVTVTVTPVNDAPEAVDDVLQVIEGRSISVDAAVLLANDMDLDGDSLNITSTGQGLRGNVALNGDGSLTYTPDAGFFGTDSFTYTVTDGIVSDTATVVISVAQDFEFVTDDFSGAVTGAGWRFEGPAGNAAALQSNGEGYLALDIPAGDYDIWNTNNAARYLQDVADIDFDLEAKFLSVPTERTQMQGILVEQDALNWIRFDTLHNGTGVQAFAAVTANGSSQAISNITIPAVNAAYLRVIRSSDDWVFQNSADGIIWTTSASFTHALEVNSVGPFAAITHAASAFEAQVDYVKLSGDTLVDDQSIPRAPVPGDDLLATMADTVLLIDVDTDLLSNDVDQNGDTVAFTGAGVPDSGTLTDNGNGTLSYTPQAGFTGVASFTYDITDGTFDATGTVTVEVDNNAPTAVADTAVVVEDTSVIIDFLTNDSDLDGDSLSLIAIGNAASGTVTDNGNGAVTYTPDADFAGADQFTYTVSDGVRTSEAAVIITVTAVDDAPRPTDDAAFTQPGAAVALNIAELLANDVEVDGQTLSFAGFAQPSNGTLVDNADGTLTYTPNTGFTGIDTFTYTVSDGTLAGTADVTITTANVIDVWYGDDQKFGNLGETQQWVNILGDLTLPGATSLSYTLNGGASRSLVIGSDGRRLENEGDFNIEIDYAELDPTAVDDVIVITATYAGGVTYDHTVTIDYEAGNDWTADYSIDWENVTGLQDVVQVVDGKWSWDANGITPEEQGYDRLLAIGDDSWDNYEVNLTITMNDLQTTDPRHGGLFALGMIWDGHTDNPVAGYDPHAGWENSTGFYFWGEDLVQHDRYYGWGGNRQPLHTREEGKTYNVTMRLEQVDIFDRQYSIKIWEEGTAEPTDWLLQKYESFTAPETGSLVLNAHYHSVTFGDITVTEIQGNDIIAARDTGDVINAATVAQAVPGQGEVDVLEGGAGADTFVLGDANGAYYDDGQAGTTGEFDFAMIWDFETGVDRIQLHGDASLYTFAAAPAAVYNGDAIYLNDAAGNDELIAVFNGSAPSIDHIDFVFDMGA